MGWYGQGRGTLAIVISAPVIVTTSPLQTAGQGLPYSATLSAIHGAPPYTFSILSGQDGNGFPSCSSGGVLSGTPASVENLVIQVQAVDSMNVPSAPVSLSLTVETAPTITTSSPLPSATSGAPYTDNLTASGGTPPYTFAIISGQDGNGFPACSASGALSGTPATSESLTLSAQVTDSVGVVSAPTSLSLTVTASSGVNYYISPTGDDNRGAGTLASPWSLNAINSQRAKYAGNNLYLMPGVYTATTTAGTTKTIYSLIQAISNTGNATALFQVQGGPSGLQPTVIASCNAAGNYSPRTAIVDCVDPVTGLMPGSAGVMIIGQTDNNTSGVGLPGQYGNFILDGIEIIHFADLGIGYHNLTNTAVGSGVIIRNCHPHHSAGTAASNNNPNAVAIGGSTGPVVTNNLIHDLTTSSLVSPSSFNPYGQIAILAIGAGNGSAPTPIGATIQNNTTYNCAGLNYKDSFATGTSEISYNYFDAGSFGNMEGATPVDPFMQFLCGTGGVINYHHNLTSALLNGTPEASIGVVGSNRGQVNAWNNTHAVGQSGALLAQPDPNTPGTWAFYNNLVATPNYTGGTTPYIIAIDNNNYGFPSLNICDYNAYQSNVTFRNHGAAVPQAQWIGTYAFDTHSQFNLVVASAFANGSGPNSIGGIPNLASWIPSGAYATASNSGGQLGAMNAQGLASDGSGKQIGCNFSAQQFPLTGGYLIGGGVQTSFGTTAFQQQVAELDVAVIGLYPGWTSGGFTPTSAAMAVKGINPNIKLFPYVNFMELEAGVGASGSPWSPVYNAANAAGANWFTRNPWPSGPIVDIEGNSQDGLNVTSYTNVVSGQNYQQWRVTWTVANEYWAGWDGVFLDNFEQGNNAKGSVDYRQTGTSVAANSSTAAQDFRTGYATMATALKSALPTTSYPPYVLGNCADWQNGTISGYSGVLNGGVIEHLITGSSGAYETQGWSTMMAAYKTCMTNMALPNFMIFAQDGSPTNYAGMRYGLCSCLLDNAYYFHSNNGNYNTVQLYDEFFFNLGGPIAGPNNPYNGTYSSGGLTVWKQGLWRRDFQNGISVVNPRGNGSQTFTFEIDVWALRGTQDPTTNNAQHYPAGTSITIADAVTAGTGGGGQIFSRTAT